MYSVSNKALSFLNSLHPFTEMSCWWWSWLWKTLNKPSYIAPLVFLPWFYSCYAWKILVQFISFYFYL